MMYELFNIEEVNLIYIFDISSREALIAEITEAMPYFVEPELTDIAVNVIKKLRRMTDADFTALELYPEYADYND